MSAAIRAFKNLICGGYPSNTRGPSIKETTSGLALLETGTGRVLTETI